MTGFLSLFGHDPAVYDRHRLHHGDRRYPETNCYTDIIIELLHARGDEAVAILGSTVRMDFEGDQWTFFKPSNTDMEELLGVDIHEMQLYRPLEDHIVEQLERGQTIVVELDSWYLPDTAATSYRSAHVKTSVAVEAIDPAGERLRYYHNTSLHELSGEDYRGALRTRGSFSDDVLPPYAEIVRFAGDRRRRGTDLVGAARDALARHLAMAPSDNPFAAFGPRLEAEMLRLHEGDAASYHEYAFATVRMAGAGFDLCAAHVDWLLGEDGRAASAALESIADATKLLGFKLARRKPFDPGPVIEEMGRAWDQALGSLCALVV